MDPRICVVTQLEGDVLAGIDPENGVRAWAYAFRADARSFRSVIADPRSLHGYDIVVVELTDNAFSIPAFIRERSPRTIVIGLIEGGVEALSAHPRWLQLRFIEAVRAVHMLGTIVADALPYYRLFVDEPRRVQWLGVPFPKQWTDTLERRPVVSGLIEISAGLEHGRNGPAALMLVERLRRAHPEVRARVYAGASAELEALRQFSPTAECRLKRPWQDYLLQHGEAFAMLSLDPRRVWGRAAADSAAAFVPYVGSDASQCARTIAELTCDPFDVESALSHVVRLLEEPGLREAVVQRQYERLSGIDEQTSRSRFWEALSAAGLT